MKFKVINGPNLNLLGVREVNVYGNGTYEALEQAIASHAEARGIVVDTFQTNHEGIIIDAIHQAYFDGYNGLIINPGAYTHYSYAIHDALKAIPLPKVEVHLSDIYQREAFRKMNVINDAVDYSIVGKGVDGYLTAIDYLIEVCRQNSVFSL